MKKACLWLALVGLGGVWGCSGSQAEAPTPRMEWTGESEAHYASALDEAFDVYSDEVVSAALLDYGSVAEAQAVVRTLSDAHFDRLLASCLAKRGLSIRGLAQFAEQHAKFFHEQQRRHWGKLQNLETTLAGIPLRVRPSAVSQDDSLIALE